jgi:hypothetical protein
MARRFSFLTLGGFLLLALAPAERRLDYDPQVFASAELSDGTEKREEGASHAILSAEGPLRLPYRAAAFAWGVDLAG